MDETMGRFRTDPPRAGRERGDTPMDTAGGMEPTIGARAQMLARDADELNNVAGQIATAVFGPEPTTDARNEMKDGNAPSLTNALVQTASRLERLGGLLARIQAELIAPEHGV